MDVVHRRCAGLDISKKDAKVAVRVVGGGRAGTKTTVTTWSSMTGQVLALREHLVAAQATCVVMEATSDYWKPFYYVLEDGPWELMLVNARHARNMPGRKTDVADAAWLAQLGAHGLVRGSFVPPAPIRALRDLTRTRTALTRERAREVQRLEKLLEDAGIKLSAVATDIVGVSGRAMLEALIAGQRDPEVLADLAKRKLRWKLGELSEALDGRFADHHAFLARTHLDLIDHLTGTIDQVTTRIEEAIAPFRGVRDLIVTVPGISTGVADVIIAETGADMTRFASPGLLGRDLPRGQRVRRPGQVHPHPTSQPLPQGRPGRRGHGRRPDKGHLPRRQAPAPRHPPRTPQGRRRRRARHARRDLAHAHRTSPLPRPWP